MNAAYRHAFFQLPSSKGAKVTFAQLSGSADAYAAAQVILSNASLHLVLTEDMQSAYRFYDELTFFISDDSYELMLFPDWEILPYDQFSPHQDIISERLSILKKLSSVQQGVLIVSIQTLMHRLPPVHYLQNILQLKPGDVFDHDVQRVRFEKAGYRCVDQVYVRGEFAIRGAIVDIYPMGAELPFRIDCFDDEVESIRVFDPETQRSMRKVEEINLLPAHEFPLTEKGIACFKANWNATFGGEGHDTVLYKAVVKQQAAQGLEYYLPLFFEETVSLLAYLPEKTNVSFMHGVYAQAEGFYAQLEHRYQQYSHDRLRPILKPEQVGFRVGDLFHDLSRYQQIQFEKKALKKVNVHNHNVTVEALPDLAVNHQSKEPFKHIAQFIHESEKRILLCAESEGRVSVLIEHMQKLGIQVARVDNWHAYVNSSQVIAICVSPVLMGTILSDPGIAIIPEAVIFSQQVLQRRRRKISAEASQIAVYDITELSEGDAVVHIEHGVGRYLGLTTLEINQTESEFLTLQYANDDKLYVPISSMHLVSRYSSTQVGSPPLHRLGSSKWQREKEKAAKKIQDTAAELLHIYAQRAAKPGFAFDEPDTQYVSFSESFPFEETPDQAKAIQEVIHDMTSPHPMDRLICGDVGFGKTEVAMRAAFMAVQGGKQVAMLVPTTLLAEQHYQTFIDRFANVPVSIDCLSRFKAASAQKKVIDAVNAGYIDIVVGTHKLLNKELKFSRLGLLIIDEEHRFGVRQKERLKAMRTEVDILTMTATPIPRTLNMSMAKIRDLSLIASPPAKRLAVKTFVKEHERTLIKEAILREVNRGGQVYYLHNEVKTIEHEKEMLEALVPELKIGLAHGQMRERELEKVMAEFYHNQFHILLCTTIIETGIDVPNANTILMNRADNLGLAQLHQLRGRVGRSHHQAYAYLLCPPRKAMTPDARKRIDAIESADALGAGFTLASHDLEIRGAGELLGDEQSGHMQNIGFSLFMSLLDRTVAALQKGEVPELEATIQPEGAEIELNISALIPEEYIADVHQRLSFYQRLSRVKDEKEIDDVQIEMIDRFGMLPESAQHLVQCAKLRLKAESIGVRKITAHAAGGKFEFTEKPKVDPMKIIRLVQIKPKQYKLQGSEKLMFMGDLPQAKDRFKEVELLFDALIN